MITNENVVSYSECSCGAITIELDDGPYSCMKSDREKFFPDIDFSELKSENETCCCNYCVNHYGLDLCSCGSGEKVGECDCGSNSPMQIVGEHYCVIAEDSFANNSDKFSSSVDKAYELANKLKCMQEELYNQIICEIEGIENLEGVKEVSSSPNVSIVSYKTISKGNAILSAEYYIKNSQISAIKKCLSGCNCDMAKLAKRIGTMIEKRIAQISSYEKVYLNENSVSTLEKVYDQIKIFA